VDGHSNPINKRNAWAARAVVYAKIIPPGAADTVHFRLKVPKDCGGKVTLTAKLNYRKFTWWNNMFAYLGRTAERSRGSVVPTGDSTVHVPTGLGYDENGKVRTSGPVSHGWDDRPMHFDADTNLVSGDIKDVPVLPTTVLAQSIITLPVVNPGEKGMTPAQPLTDDDKKKDRVRWNDYGIGLLLQGDFRNATNAFEQVTRVAPKWPEGWVNIGRVRQAERDSKAARTAFEKAFALYDAYPTPMTKYQKARTQNFYAQTLFDQGQLEQSLAILKQVRDVFPEDRNVRNLAGTILFRLGRYDEAIQQLQHTLTIDPEDIVAHYNLMKCYRGKGDAESQKQAAAHEQLYRRFKADETTTNLIGPYLRAHPADNNLVARIHEHGDAIITPMPAWLKTRLQKIARGRTWRLAYHDAK
jgi:tetratricopeptide (TPR) repeat protein